MEQKQLKQKTVSGLMWRFFERCGAQGVNLLVQIILARLLLPEMFGTIALVTVFTNILQIFIDSGMANALIQKKNADDVDFSSVFYFNIALSVILYLGMFIASPFIADFFKDGQLTSVVRVMSISLIIGGIKNVQQAYVSRNMMFKKFFFSTLIGTIVAAVVGVVMAYKGFGVWALVAQDLTNKTIDTFVLWFTVKWRPKILFSWKRLKGLINYGWKLLASGLIDTVYNNVRQLIIGKMYKPASLGFYNRGQQFPDTIINNINTSIDSVIFPAMSSEQDDKVRLKALTRRSIKTSSYIIWPMMVGLATIATPLICFLLTEKWLGAVPYLRLFCLINAFQPIHTSNLNAIKALGRSGLFLKLEIIKKAIGIISILITMWYGPLAIVYGLLVTSIISQAINAWPNKKLLNYSYWEQIKDILPYIVMSGVMAIAIYFIAFINIPRIIVLCVQVAVGVAVYIAMSKLFKIDSYDYIKDIVKNIIKRKEKVSD